MQIVQYPIRNGINFLFELPTQTAKKWLPAGLEPIEVNHGVSLIGITLFDFSESPIGPYHELVVSLYIVPLLGLTDAHPHAAVHPLVVASTNHEARQHAIDLWRLPHFMEDIHIDFQVSPDGLSISGKVYTSDRQPILELSTRQSGPWKPVYQLYQSFQGDQSGDYTGIMDMKGQLREHEESTGSVTLYPHRFFEQIDLSDVDLLPLREMWMKDGVESYHRLIKRGATMEVVYG